MRRQWLRVPQWGRAVAHRARSLDDHERTGEIADLNGQAAYPAPMPASGMPMAFMDAEFGAPFPNQPADSVQFTWANLGSLNGFPYARLQHDSECGMSLHVGAFVRQLPPDRTPRRYGVWFIAPAGPSRPGANVSVYRNDRLLTRAERAASPVPSDGSTAACTRSTGSRGLYDVRQRSSVRSAGAYPARPEQALQHLGVTEERHPGWARLRGRRQHRRAR